MKKNIFLMLFVVVSWQHALAQSFTYNGLNYNVTGSTIVEVANNSGATGAIIIPSIVLYNSSTLTVTSISNGAFFGNGALTSVTIPDSVTNISNYAFYSCSGLTTVTIGNSVTSIGGSSFSECFGLTSVTIGNSVISISDYAFNNCSGLTSVIIPNSVTTIGDNAFYACSGLTSVTIPNLVTSIGTSTFSDCIALSSVIIGDSVTSIGDNAFENCTGLTSLTIIGNALTSIGSHAFNNCSVLASLTIPDSVTSIGNRSFNSCSSLTSVTIGNSITSISDGAFFGCSSLTSVTIPNSVTSIAYGAFYGCSGLTSVTIPNSVTTIGANAFANCTGLTVLTIGNAVTNIGDLAFSGCSNLTSVICTIETPLSINSNVFAGVNQSACSLVVPVAGLVTYLATAVWKDFAPITTDNSNFNITYVSLEACSSYTWENNSETYSISGIYTGTTTNGVTELLVLTVSDIPTNFTSEGINYVVTSSSTVAVGGNSGASGSINIPSTVSTSCGTYTVTSISEGAFIFCSGLTSVTIPNSVTSIGKRAFLMCTSLTSVICNVVNPFSIESNVFIGVNQSACTLSVPDVAAYQAAAVWKNFSPITCLQTVNTTTISASCNYTWANNSQTYTESGIYTGTTTNCVTEALHLTITITAPPIPSLSVVDQYCDDVTGYLGLKTQSQTFTAGASGSLNKISIYLGNPNGDASATNLTVQVYEGSGISGTLLGSQTYVYPAQWGYQNIDFNFSNIAVMQGQVYTFKLSTPSVSHGFVGIDTDNTYIGGSLDFAPSSDMIFKTYVNRSNQTFCQGASVANLNVEGTNVNWYYAATGGNQLNSASLLETGTYFVSSQISNLCESERVAVNVLVNPITAITSQPAANFICSAVGSTSTFAVESNADNPTYTWQYRVATTANSNPEWITITSANAAVYSNFNSSTLTLTKTTLLPATGTQYRVLVSGTCGVATSDVAPLTILSAVKGGTITSAASVCIGSDITLTLSAYAGSSFQWQSSQISTTAVPGMFTNIPGATGTTYTIVGANNAIDKSYRVIVTNSCAMTTATTATKTITLNQLSVPGTVKGGGTICSGSNATLSVTGNTGAIQWQYSLDGIEFKTVPYWKTVATVPTFFNPDNSTTFSTAASTGIAATYSATNITTDTYFRAKITSGACSEVYSNAVQYTIGTAAVAGTLTVANEIVCSSTGNTLTLTGSLGSIKWLKSTNWTATSPTWSAVTTSTSGILSTGNLTVSTAYKAEVTIGSCSTETSQVVPVMVFAAPLAKTITANITSPTGASSALAICPSTSKVLTIGAGSVGAIQWQRSSTSSTSGFVDIADETATSYTVTNPTVGANYFRAKFTNSCGASVFGTAFTVYYKECTSTKDVATNATGKSRFAVVAFPNPFSNNFKLEVTTSSSENVAVSVYDIIGKLIRKDEIKIGDVPELQIGDNYPAGVYNIIVNQGVEVKTLRVIKR